jgi:hypothetical protein
MQINLVWDSSVLAMSTSLQANFEAAVTYAANYFDTLLVSPYAVTIDVGWGEITQNGVSTPITTGGEALCGPNLGYTYTYAQSKSGAPGSRKFGRHGFGLL